MNKSESKYFNTALLMNQALLEILNKKDYEFITIQEICKKAGVNRSTFYLHYENIDDLLAECIENINKRFVSYFDEDFQEMKEKIRNGKREDLILTTPKYVIPYLKYIEDNKTVFQVSVRHPSKMQSFERYKALKNEILFPIFKKFEIDEKRFDYISSYYINGLSAIINEWIGKGCKDDVNFISEIILQCIPQFVKNYENKTSD